MMRLKAKRIDASFGTQIMEGRHAAMADGRVPGELRPSHQRTMQRPADIRDDPLEAHLVVSGLPPSSGLIRRDVALTPPTDDVSA
jgi:hypothetical protein